jgi:hypothetical protein
MIHVLMSLLDVTDHSVYCGDEKERKRLNISPCPRCAWDKLKNGIDTKKSRSDLKKLLESAGRKFTD